MTDTQDPAPVKVRRVSVTTQVTRADGTVEPSETVVWEADEEDE